MTTRTNSAKWMGTRWQINVQKDGQRKSFYSSKPGRTGQREANAKADKWLETGVAPTSMRVAEAYALWYDTQQQTTGEGNCQNIASRWRQWIGPNIGRKKLSNLTEQDLQNVVNKAHAAGLAPSTMNARLQGRSTFRAEEMQRLGRLLGIDPAEYFKYFMPTERATGGKA